MVYKKEKKSIKESFNYGTVKEILKKYYTKDITDFEVYIDKYEPKLGFRTDYIQGVEDYSDNDKVIDFEIMDKDEYSNSILANSRISWEDYGFDDDDKILVIKIEQIDWDELYYLCNSKLIKDGIEEVNDYMSDLDEDGDEIEDCEQTINAFEHLEDEINRSVKDKEITEDLSVIVGVLYTNDYLFSGKVKSMIADIESWISDNE